MSKAAELAALIGSQTALSNRNLIINGAMQVAQRGTSSTGVTYGDYWNAPDRWRIDLNALGTYTMSQSTTAPDGFSNSYKVACTVADASPAAGDYFKFQQCIEGQNVQHLQHGSSSAKKLTVSFWVRSSKTGTYTLELEHVDATYFNPKTYSISTADTWEHKTLTFDGYQTTAIANDATTGLRLNWWLGAGSTYDGGTFTDGTWHNTTANRVSGSNVNIGDSTSNDWYITGVQAELGEQDTPFEHRSYGDEISRCQRYYYFTNKAFGVVADSDDIILHGSFPCEMRATPSVSGGPYEIWQFTLGGTKTQSGASNNAYQIDKYQYNVQCGNFSGLSQHYPVGMNSGGPMKFDAELS